jgi:hypothetical protein
VKEAADAAAAREATEEVAKKKASEEAAVRKMVVDEVAGKKKAAEKAAVKRKVIDQVAVKKDSEEVVKKTKSGAATMGSGPSPSLSAGVKRVATPSGSTPLAKWQFHDSWKPRYAMRLFICHFLFHICDFNLVSLVYSVPSSSRSPPSRGPASWVQPKLLSPRTPSKPN